MKFEYFRFLLTPVKEPELPLVKRMERSELVQDIFSDGKHYKFKSGRATYGFVTKRKQGSLIQARIGKLTTARLHSSPDKGFAEKIEEDWPGSNVFINLDDEKESGKTRDIGQTIAFELNRSAIANSVNCLRALADSINQTIIHHGYYITINPILMPKKSFWSVVDEYDGKIKKIILTYTPPNLFNLQNSLEDDLRTANENFNTTSTQIVLENEVGHLKLPKENQLLQQSAEYIDLGNGSFSLHLRDGKTKVVKSESGVKTETFSGVEMNLTGKSVEDVQQIIESILLKRHD